MSDHRNQRRFESDAELEREIRRDRKFSLEDAIGRMAGPRAMKGESPMTRLQQGETEIALRLRAQPRQHHKAPTPRVQFSLRR